VEIKGMKFGVIKGEKFSPRPGWDKARMLTAIESRMSASWSYDSLRCKYYRMTPTGAQRCVAGAFLDNTTAIQADDDEMDIYEVARHAEREGKDLDLPLEPTAMRVFQLAHDDAAIYPSRRETPEQTAIEWAQRWIETNVV
jgi:hypothetical protein